MVLSDIQPGNVVTWNPGDDNPEILVRVRANYPHSQTMTVEEVRTGRIRDISWERVTFLGSTEDYLRYELAEERAKLDWLLANCSITHESAGGVGYVVTTRAALNYVQRLAKANETFAQANQADASRSGTVSPSA